CRDDQRHECCRHQNGDSERAAPAGSRDQTVWYGAAFGASLSASLGAAVRVPLETPFGGRGFRPFFEVALHGAPPSWSARALAAPSGGGVPASLDSAPAAPLEAGLGRRVGGALGSGMVRRTMFSARFSACSHCASVGVSLANFTRSASRRK